MQNADLLCSNSGLPSDNMRDVYLNDCVGFGLSCHGRYEATNLTAKHESSF
jgi:hypothetical protein